MTGHAHHALTDDTWKDSAACLGKAGLFDSVDDIRAPAKLAEHYAPALAICDTCPVRARCYLLGVQDKADGVYGGVILRDGKRASANRIPRKWEVDWSDPRRPVIVGAEHGYVTYTRGCRCEVCTEAMRAYTVLRRQRKASA